MSGDEELRRASCDGAAAFRGNALRAFTLSAVIEPALELLRLVGADKEEDRAGIAGGKSIVLSSLSDSENRRLRRDGRSNTGPELPVADSLSNDPPRGTELTLIVLLERLLDVERSEGSLLVLGLLEDLRSGTTTTGIAPLFQTSRLARPLARELVVAVEAKLSR